MVPYDAMSEPELTNDYEVYTQDWDDAYAFGSEFEDGVNIDLIEALDRAEMRPRLWRVEPGEKLSYHYHEEQEELFYVVSGTGQMLIGEDKELVEIPEGGFIKPGVSTPRSLRNDTDEDVVWLIVGAPPVFEGILWDEYDEQGRPDDSGEFVDVHALV
jgi:mannose-6-phosphate isomerase-like protein (cupin superfamily)